MTWLLDLDNYTNESVNDEEHASHVENYKDEVNNLVYSLNTAKCIHHKVLPNTSNIPIYTSY